MTEPLTDPPTQDIRAKSVGWTLLFVAALVLIPVVIALFTVRSIFTGDDPPRCDSEAVVLEWDEGARGWRRSEPFTLDASQTVQVDVRLFDSDGGVIQVGSTVYATPASEPFPDLGETSTTTNPFRGVRVGHGREAVNEQIRLDAGDWEIVLRGDAAPVEVRWPC